MKALFNRLPYKTRLWLARNEPEWVDAVQNLAEKAGPWSRRNAGKVALGAAGLVGLYATSGLIASGVMAIVYGTAATAASAGIGMGTMRVMGRQGKGAMLAGGAFGVASGIAGLVMGPAGSGMAAPFLAGAATPLVLGAAGRAGYAAGRSALASGTAATRNAMARNGGTLALIGSVLVAAPIAWGVMKENSDSLDQNRDFSAANVGANIETGIVDASEALGVPLHGISLTGAGGAFTGAVVTVVGGTHSALTAFMREALKESPTPPLSPFTFDHAAGTAATAAIDPAASGVLVPDDQVLTGNKLTAFTPG